MMERMDDSDLRQAFRSLAHDARRATPPFDAVASPSVLRATRQRHLRRRAIFALGVASVSISSFFIVRQRLDTAFDYEQFTAATGIDLEAVNWQAPSDFLLDLNTIQLQQPAPVAAPDTNVPSNRRL